MDKLYWAMKLTEMKWVAIFWAVILFFAGISWLITKIKRRRKFKKIYEEED